MLLAALGALGSPQCSVLPRGYYSSPTRYVSGAPPASSLKLVLQPDFLTCEEVERLNAHCVEQINRFRAGELRFTGGFADFHLGQLLPLRDASNNARCEAEAALGSFASTGLNNCSVAKTPVNACGAMAGVWRQSTCCPRNAGGTYASVRLALDTCLQEQFDQGLSMDEEGARTADWLNIKSPTSAYASCGFAFGKTPSGGNVVLMTQNYASRYSPQAGSSTKAPTTSSPPKDISSSADEAVCGNGVVEAGEECDCGNQCAQDACCVAATCKLAANAACSAMDACCDRNTCSVKAANQVCRASAGACDPVEVCNGNSPKCPQDARLAAGANCGAAGQDRCSPCGDCIPTMSKQCGAYRTRLVRTCDWLPITDMCEGMYCTDGLDDLACWGRPIPRLGTLCGIGKFCSQGQCVSEAQVACPQSTRSPFTPSPTQPPSMPRPSTSPTDRPTRAPTEQPTAAPSNSPTNGPTLRPSKLPTARPSSKAPTKLPTTKRPTLSPFTLSPTFKPTSLPTADPSSSPTMRPSAAPSTSQPTLQPTSTPTKLPTRAPTKLPTLAPTKRPTFAPTKLPTRAPTKRPTSTPTKRPTLSPAAS